MGETCENVPVSPTVLRSGPYRFFFFASDRAEPVHFHVARDDKTAKFDKETQELIAAIQKLQKEAEGHCDMLDAECAKGDAGGEMLQSCCSDLYKTLKEADALHNKLMAKLGIKKFEIEKAPEPKK